MRTFCVCAGTQLACSPVPSPYPSPHPSPHPSQVSGRDAKDPRRRQLAVTAPARVGRVAAPKILGACDDPLGARLYRHSRQEPEGEPRQGEPRCSHIELRRRRGLRSGERWRCGSLRRRFASRKDRCRGWSGQHCLWSSSFTHWLRGCCCSSCRWAGPHRTACSARRPARVVASLAPRHRARLRKVWARA